MKTRRTYWGLLILLSCLLATSFSCAKQLPAPTPAPVTAPTPTTKPTPTPTPAPAPKPIELKFATFVAANYLTTKAEWDNFAVPLMEKSGGRVKVVLFAGAALGSAAEHYDLTATGIAAFAQVTPTYQAGVFPLWELANSLGSGTCVRSQKVLVEVMKLGYFNKEFANIKVLGPIAAPPRGLVLTKKKVQTLADMTGLRIRIGGQFESDVSSRAGAVPVAIDMAEVYTSLSKGMLDGALFNAPSLPGYKFWEVAKYYLNLHLAGSTTMFVFNKNRFASLPPDIQALIEQLGPTAALSVSKAFDDAIDDALKTARTNGMEVYEVSPEEQAKWQDLTDTTLSKQADQLESKGLPGRDLLQTYRKIEKTVK